MKKAIILLISLFLNSCCKDDKINTEIKANPADFLVLLDPDINLNIISTGELQKKILSITSANYLNNPPDTYNFEYVPNSNKIKKIFYQGNNLCENETNTYFYNSLNMIDKVENFKVRDCPPEFESTTTYKYNYVNQILKSVIGTNESFIYELFFSYNSNGTIKEFYTNIRPTSEFSYGYSKISLKYDANNNVKEIVGNDFYSSNYDQKTILEYDDKINPLKGLFVTNIFNRPYASNYLNNNNIVSTKSDYINIATNPTINYYKTNFINNQLINYGDVDGYPYWREYFINYQ